ncbi:MAG TPA: DUF4199 domain-containing protein [Mucilaginibacter sp.]|nr:DUF4199 domain-containing protein [Mucilaginibacter sp.]
MQTLEQKVRKSGFKNGLILGLLITILNILSFYLITSPSISALAFIVAPIIFRAFIPMLLVLFLCFKIRKNVGGLWTFKQATTGIFIMLITAYLFNLLGKDLLFDKVIEPNGIEKTKTAAINAKTANMKEKGFSQDKIDASIADMKKGFTPNGGFSIGGFLTENVFIILILFVFALIFASLIRNAEYVPAPGKK